MEMMRKRLGILLAAALVLACFISLPAKAEEDGAKSGEFTYKVRIFAGKQGTINGREVETYYIAPGDTKSFDADSVKLNNGSKYYVKGIRESGKDSGDVYIKETPKVERDTDYVVAYGLKSSMVKYTVRYVDDVSGIDLAAPETYYGSVGDKPVISYLYIEGYQPRAYNLTKTLEADENENVFTFRYTLLTGAQNGGTVTTLPGTTRRTQTTREEVQNAGGAAAGGGGAADAADEDGVELPDPEVPLDTIDLDTMTDEGVYIEDPSVPLSEMKFQLGPIEMDAKRLVVTLVILMAAAAIAAANLWFWKPRRKKEKNDEKDAARSV